MKKQIRLALLSCAALVSMHLTAQEVSPKSVPGQSAPAPTFVRFDVPGACTTYSFPCTQPTAIDSQGTVAGYYFDDTYYASHAFFRLADGTITTFDVPGAPPCTIAWPSLCVTIAAINSGGTIIGSYFTQGSFMGFLRDRYGNFTKFTVSTSMDTVPTAINSAGEITGYWDVYEKIPGGESLVAHGFVRNTQGNFTFFDPPNSAGTKATSINSQGEIAGNFGTAEALSIGFLRSSDGHFTILDPPGMDTLSLISIADSGEIVGAGYNSSDGEQIKSFIRDPEGNYSTFSVVPAGDTQTMPVGLDTDGTLVGYYANHSEFHGFYRLQNSALGFFDPPGSASTVPAAVNPQGNLTGYFFDPNNSYHGFIRINP
jgi:hypothetical protein